jgi:signal peptidase II
MAPSSSAATSSLAAPGERPSYLFLGVLAGISFVADVGSKLWAERTLVANPGFIEVVPNHLAFVLAKNKGGAWGILQGTSEHIRRPFFLLVSLAAVIFILTLYRRLQPKQYALQWGLPLVLGGALGNVFDRVRYGHVIDFIDYRSQWVQDMNDFFVRIKIAQGSTDHWPTFNIADVAICIGVGLMAVDMFTAPRRELSSGASVRPPAPAGGAGGVSHEGPAPATPPSVPPSAGV